MIQTILFPTCRRRSHGDNRTLPKLRRQSESTELHQHFLFIKSPPYYDEKCLSTFYMRDASPLGRCLPTLLREMILHKGSACGGQDIYFFGFGIFANTWSVPWTSEALQLGSGCVEAVESMTLIELSIASSRSCRSQD